MELKFNYVNAKGEKKPRVVVVIHENDEKIQGLDIHGLDRATQNKIKKLFLNKAVTPIPTTRTPLDYEKLGISKDVFRQCFRTFNKSNIC